MGYGGWQEKNEWRNASFWLSKSYPHEIVVGPRSGFFSGIHGITIISFAARILLVWEYTTRFITNINFEQKTINP